MIVCYKCGHQITISTEETCPNCGQTLRGRIANDNSGKYSINIHNTKGEIINIGFSCSGNNIGKNIVVGSDTIIMRQHELANISIPEYAKALKDFSESINGHLEGRQISEEKVEWINNSLEKLAKEVEDIQPRDVQREQVDYLKQIQIELKIAGVIQRVLDVLPEDAETVSTFTPLDPFSKLIGRYIQEIVDAISKRRK